MASNIKKGETLLIPFRNGVSISDSQLKPRMYKTVQAFERAFPKHYLGTDGVELVEYAPVVRCKDCRNWECHEINGRKILGRCHYFVRTVRADDFCSYGERRTDETKTD